MTQPPALTRENWVTAALDGLHDEGVSAIRIEPLARRLKVTKGSFYWHFKDAAALKYAALEGWQSCQLALVDRLRAESSKTPEDRVRALVNFTISKDSRHDVGVRAWALTNKAARKAVSRVDRARLSFLEEIFSLCGYDKDGCALRARMLYYYQVGEYSAAIKDPESRRKRHAKMRADWLLR